MPWSSTNRSQWVARVERLNRSGLAVGEFAAKERVHPGTLALWRSRLQASGEVSSSVAMSFVALEPIDRPSISEPVPFEVGFGDGRTVRVWPGFDAAELTRLIAVLEGATR